MSKVRVVCPNHGVIKEIEMACMWLGNPPMPERECAFCPRCGAKLKLKGINQIIILNIGVVTGHPMIAICSG